MHITAIYASTAGHVETTVEYVAEVWRGLGHVVELHRAEKTSPEIFSTHQDFFIATSTWEHGELNPFFMPIYTAWKEMDLKGKRASFLGLGDTRYEPVHFGRGVDYLQQRWVERGGTMVGPMLKINGEPYHQLEAIVKPWAAKVMGGTL
jgi:flavodoxin